MLIDAGPLVALIHADDRHHKRCTDILRKLAEPLATVSVAEKPEPLRYNAAKVSRFPAAARGRYDPVARRRLER